MSKKTTSDLFSVALELRQCANAWEPDVTLIGNVRASDVAALCADYARLRLHSGIGNKDVVYDLSLNSSNPVLDKG